MKIKSITIEGFHNVSYKTYTFDTFNYITGPNGSGKSTILNAIEYALFGYIPGTKKNSNEELYKHASSPTMQITLEIADQYQDISLTRSLTRVDNKFQSKFSIEPNTYAIEDIISDLELPVFNFNEFIGMTSNKLKDWFIDFLPSTSFETDWDVVLKNSSGVEHILDENLLPFIKESIKGYGLSGLDELRKANECIKAALSFKKQEAQRLQNTMQSLVYYDDFSEEASIPAINAELAGYRGYKQAIQERESAIAYNQSIDARIKQLNTGMDVDALKIQIEAERADSSKLSQEIVELNSKVSALDAEIKTKTKIINGGGICPYTSNPCGDISKLVSEYRNQVIEGTAKLAEYNARLKELVSQNTTSTNKINTWEELLRSNMKAAVEIESLKGSYKTVVDVSNIPSIEEIDAKITELEDKLIKIKANEKYQSMIDVLTQEKDMLEQSIGILKKWDALTGINGLQATSGTDPFVEFSKTIREYLPEGMFGESHIHFLSQGKNNTFSFGLMNNDQYIPFDLLSSGEKCIYTIALLLALIKQSESNLKILVIDDLLDHLDDTNLNVLFDLLKQTEGVQLIFAGVKTLKYSYSDLKEIHPGES